MNDGSILHIGFPRVIGAIDSTRIPITTALGEHEGDFVDRKSIYSINVQILDWAKICFEVYNHNYVEMGI